MAQIRGNSMNSRMRLMTGLAPRGSTQLRRFVAAAMGLRVPAAALCAQNTPPLAYLERSFFHGGDTVVWACRGGGKTMLGAAATLLDLLFKPGIEVRILAGSFEQASRMHDHLAALLDRPMLRGLVAGKITQKRVELLNGSAAEILAQSHRAVRGVRVQKLRCDEVEEIDPDIWQAAQLVTRSAMCGGRMITGGIEALSTMHRPFGLMSRLTERSAHVMRWNALDVIERCPPQRPCDGCPLEADCHGMAKEATGFVRVDDLIAQKQRVDEETWASEILCQRPRRSESVYPCFDLQRHVMDPPADAAGPLLAGMDFGLRNATVFLWAQLTGQVLHVIDEYVQSGRTLDQNLMQIMARGYGRVAWVGVDPAGEARNEHTGLSNVQSMTAAGWRVRSTRLGVEQGIGLVRSRLHHDTLRVSPRCRQLIQAMKTYHFDPLKPTSETPVKDGPDHACDALRYLVVNLERGAGEVTVRRWA